MLVDISELTARLPFTMDEDETREANGALADLSFDAQAIGSPKWTDPLTTPQAVKNLIVRAAACHMKNYEGYTVSRAGDETVEWAEQDNPGQASFNDDERRMLRQMGGTLPFIGTVSQVAYGTRARPRTGYVPVSYAPGYPRADFPYYADEGSPW